MGKKSYSIKFKLDAVELAERTSANGAARKLNVDQKQIRMWRQQKVKLLALCTPSGTVRKNLSGAGPKLSSASMEEELVDWIESLRSTGARVSRKMIRVKAEELFQNVDDATRPQFQASVGWLDKFLHRNGFSSRRHTTVAQKTPDQFVDKIVSFISFVGMTRDKYQIQDQNIIAMDETAIFFDMLSNTTVEKKGAKTVTILSTGHEKAHATVVLAAAGDGRKLKPFIVFKQAIREVKKMQDIIGVKVVSTKNGWMNDETTCDWLDSVFGKISFGKRMLAWDSYRCHISAKVKGHLKKFNCCTAVVPGGCTKYVQAPDLSWNKPFKDRVREMYDEWFAGDDEKEYTSGGNLKAPNKRLLVNWILKSWNELSLELIQKSFKATGVTVATDGSEDSEIHCFKMGQPCREGLASLTHERSLQRELNDAIQLPDEIDEDEDLVNEIVIEDDDD